MATCPGNELLVMQRDDKLFEYYVLNIVLNLVLYYCFVTQQFN